MNIPEFIPWIFMSGCIGALAPEIVRLYKMRHNPRFEWHWFYVIISLLFALLGGFIAWILPATSLYGAFYAGVACPIIVSTIFGSKKLPKDYSSLQQIEKFIQPKPSDLLDKIEKEIHPPLSPEQSKTLKKFISHHESTLFRFYSELASTLESTMISHDLVSPKFAKEREEKYGAQFLVRKPKMRLRDYFAALFS